MGQEERARTDAEGGPGFDARLERLEAIVGELEQGGLELEASVDRYREGVALLKGCREQLASFQRQVEELTREGEGLEPYADDPDLGGAGEPGGARP